MLSHQHTISVFISYDQNDEALLRELEKHLSVLKRQSLISTWHQRQIVPGTNRAEAIDKQLQQASIILLLVSADFLASDYYDLIEMKGTLEQPKVVEARIVPIIIRPCDWKASPLAHLAILPDTEKPLTEWHNRDAAFSNIVAGIRRVIDEIMRASEQEIYAPQSEVWNVPYRRNPLFTGRDELLDRLQKQLTPVEQNEYAKTRKAALTQSRAIKGIGGIGKTQIVVEYAYRSRDLNRYTHTIWINATNEEAIISSFVTIAKLLPTFSARNETDQQKLVEAVKQWLEQCLHSWLLIFDNVDSDNCLSLLPHYFPQQGKGSILITTRSHAIGSLAMPSITVEEMDPWEGTLLLLRRAQLFEHTSIEDASDEEAEIVNAARGIVDALESFPLAIEQAGAYIDETKSSLADYLQIYQDHRKDLLARRGHQITNYPDTVATTWSLSFQKVEQVNPAAAELLRICSFLAPDKIPEELIRGGSAFWSTELQRSTGDIFTFNQMIEELLKFSLIKRLAENHVLSIHRLVQAVQIDMIEPQLRSQWAESVVRAVDKVFPANPQDVTSWSQCAFYLDQAQMCNILIENYMLSFTEAGDLLNRTGMYLESMALYAIAEPLFVRAVAISEEQLGIRHPDTASFIHNLGHLCFIQGRYEQAEPLLQRALTIYKEQLEPNHPNMAHNLNSLAVLYTIQGKYEQAEPLLQRALAIREEQLGPHHTNTANSLINLGSLYTTQGKYEQAEPLLQQALTINEKQLGSHHLNTANSLFALCSFYITQGKYKQTEPILQRVLAIHERQLGSLHPDTQTVQRHYATLLQVIGTKGKRRGWKRIFNLVSR